MTFIDRMEGDMKKNIRVIFLIFLNFFSLSFMIFFNIISFTLPLNSHTTGELADKYSALIVPVDITFSIWLIIYILLILFVLNQLFFILNGNGEKIILIEKTSGYFFFSSILNVLWLVCWHYEMIFLSVFVMVLLLIDLIILYKRFETVEMKNVEKILFVKAPISIYLGWISFATVANSSSYIASLNLNIFKNNEIFWTIIVLIFTLLLGLFMIVKKRDLFFVLVFVWCYIGIILKMEIIKLNGTNLIKWFSFLSILILVLVTIFYEIKNFKEEK